jgi:hypothetical protein
MRSGVKEGEKIKKEMGRNKYSCEYKHTKKDLTLFKNFLIIWCI